MYKLIDFKWREDYNSYSIDVEDYYKVRNIETGKEKWIDNDTYKSYKRLGLIIESEGS